MEPDAATYAIISMEMLDRADFEITARGLDWLDKPHFPFWITAISLKIFGVNNFGYKLPALLFTILGAIYTFRFAKHHYSIKHGYLAVIILLTSLHLILANNDVRAEPFLLGQTIFSLYYFTIFLDKRRWKDLLLGSLGLAALMMTKGLFTIIPVTTAIFFHLLYYKDWKNILDWRWIAAGFATIIFMSPVLYSYYLQFDLHPEKIIFGQSNVSGIKFFSWDSQWGRFSNSGPIQGQGDPFFFIHTMLWAFAPWAFLLYFGLYQSIKGLVRKTFKGELFTFFGFIIIIIIFSISKFQLPHYVVPLFPLLAVFTANTIISSFDSAKFFLWFKSINSIIIALLILAVGLLQYYFNGSWLKWDTTIIGGVSILLAFVSFRSSSKLVSLVYPPSLIILFCMYFMNREFYPGLMKYQSESEVAIYIKKHKIPVDDFTIFGRNVWVTDFYLHNTVPVSSSISQLNNKYVFCNDAGLEEIRKATLKFEIVQTFHDFHVTTLNATFINRETRNASLQNNYLLLVE